VLNEDDVVATLSAVAAAHGLTVDQFDHTKYTTIQSLIDYFSTARGLIGPHGGCLTNTVFLGCNSLVVELFPLVNGVKPPIGHPGVCIEYASQEVFLQPSRVVVTAVCGRAGWAGPACCLPCCFPVASTEHPPRRVSSRGGMNSPCARRGVSSRAVPLSSAAVCFPPSPA
jgi:hypothetical protein